MEAAQDKIYVPPGFYCPITSELINIPVTDHEGNSYEKSEILKWIKKNKSSPITRSYLDESLLHDDIRLKRDIDSIRSKLTEEQLRIDTQVSEIISVPFKSATDGIELNSYYFDDQLFVNIITPDIVTRPPVDIVLCIDVSYSMYEPATLKGEQNESLNHGFSVLSLTVVAAKTILHSLNENDNISIVTYSSEARTLLENVACTAENKTVIECELDTLKPISNTNMWAGIHSSLDILRTTSPANKMKGILLLTDGIPNVVPPRGHINMLEKYFRDHNFNCMFSCYGFGYNLESKLLSEISACSNGDGFSFIPDASLLGTTFIHGISNLLTTAVYNPSLTITLNKDVYFDNGSNELEISIDSLKYGKSKNLMIHVNTDRASSRSSDYLNDFARIQLTFDGKTFETNENKRPERDYYIQQKFRNEAIVLLENCIAKKNYNDNSFKDDMHRFTESLDREKSVKFVQDLIYDINGQVKEALNMTSQGESEDWFTRWGRHYLLSLKEAYQKELCNNFKDKVIANFGGTLFNTLRDEISDIFDARPLPKRDIKIHRQRRNSGRFRSQSVATPQAEPARARTPPTSMASYNNSGGGCCVEGSQVLMHDSTYKNVETIRKDDKVRTYNTYIDQYGDYHYSYSTSTIECVVRTKCKDNQVSVVKLNDLEITPYHPIIDKKNKEKHWVYPINKGKVKSKECEYIYSFVVKNRQSLIIDEYVYATLGHNLHYDEVIQHNYFGTEKVINDLKRSKEYINGLISLEQSDFQRDNVTNDIFTILI